MHILIYSGIFEIIFGSLKNNMPQFSDFLTFNYRLKKQMLPDKKTGGDFVRCLKFPE